MRQSDNDVVTVVGAGVTLAEANKAADALALDGINIRVVDPFTLKPLDAETIIASARKTGGRIVTVEDHYPEGTSTHETPQIMCQEHAVASWHVAELTFVNVRGKFWVLSNSVY